MVRNQNWSWREQIEGTVEGNKWREQWKGANGGTVMEPGEEGFQFNPFIHLLSLIRFMQLPSREFYLCLHSILFLSSPEFWLSSPYSFIRKNSMRKESCRHAIFGFLPCVRTFLAPLNARPIQLPSKLQTWFHFGWFFMLSLLWYYCMRTDQ